MLGLTTAAVVVSVLGILTAIQQSRETRRERAAAEALLAESLPPLALDVERAANFAEVRARLESFHRAHGLRGGSDHRFRLTDDRGRVLASSGGGAPRADAITASVRVQSSVFGKGALTVHQDGSAFRAAATARWLSRWLDIGITAICILVFLYLANRMLVTKPLTDLLSAMGKLGAGYRGADTVTRGAWEVRWLAWRFQEMGGEMEETVRRLLEAERRAQRFGGPAQPNGGEEADERSRPAEQPAAPKGASIRRDLSRHYLWGKCRLLESADPANAATRAAAREAWEHDVLEAEKLGEIHLRARLEDAALSVLEPDAHRDLGREIAALRVSHRRWFEDQERVIRKALGERGIPFSRVASRMKHVAGVYRKMKAKDLSLDQIHDVFAFRIVVPREQDCYTALGAMHEIFTPRVLRFKDYIAEPKPSGYRSLHTTVSANTGPIFEIQIRTARMDEQSEGDYPRYKTESAISPAPGLGLNWLVRRTAGRRSERCGST